MAAKIPGNGVESSGAFTIGATGTSSSLAGIPFFSDTTNGSIYTHDVSGTDDTAANNTAYGLTALDAVTTGDNNTALGYSAGGGLTSGASNTSVGYEAMGAGTVTGSENEAVGRRALKNLTSGEGNVAIGTETLLDTTSGSQNVAIGKQALENCNSGGNNVAVGYQTLRNTTGAANIAIGKETAKSNTSGVRIIAIGAEAYDGADTENDNLAIGEGALGGSVAGGEYNIAIGNYAGDALTSGDHNTLVGYNAGSGLTTGGSNVLIGSSLTMADVTDSNAIIIGTGISGNGDRFSFGKGSNVVQNTFTSDANWSRTSDERLKTNITSIDYNGLNFINELRPVTFNWKASQDVPTDMEQYKANENLMDTDTTIDFLIAQEVKAAMDKHGINNFSGWKEDNDKGKTQLLSKEAFVVPLIKAVQELSAKVKALEEA